MGSSQTTGWTPLFATHNTAPGTQYFQKCPCPLGVHLGTACFLLLLLCPYSNPSDALFTEFPLLLQKENWHYQCPPTGIWDTLTNWEFNVSTDLKASLKDKLSQVCRFLIVRHNHGFLSQKLYVWSTHSNKLIAFLCGKTTTEDQLHEIYHFV